VTSTTPSPLTRFRVEYGAHRAAEGRAYTSEQLASLPYLECGDAGLVRQWSVRARTFDAFVRLVLEPSLRRRGRPVRLVDLGAGNGWLSWRAAIAGCDTVAVDIRDDAVDGLGGGRFYTDTLRVPISRVVASFDALPLAGGRFGLAVFNASLHYALDLRAVLREARRLVGPGGRIVVLDSPFYARDSHGQAMVAEKRRDAERNFGSRAEALLGLPFTEYLTRDRLEIASAGLGLTWRRHRVRYPIWYEARPVLAWLRRRRAPSRFDLWCAGVGDVRV